MSLICRALRNARATCPRTNINSSAVLWNRLSTVTQNQKVKILYGSQTGTAQSFAEQLATEASKHRIDCEVVDLSNYDANNLNQESTAVFVMACYGSGEPTDNARTFYEQFIAPDFSPKLPNAFKYAVFGLGNSTTHKERFNVVGKAVDQKLEQLGGKRALPLGLGDDSQCIEIQFDEWQEELLKTLAQQKSSTKPAEPTSSTPSTSSATTTTTTSSSQTNTEKETEPILPWTSSKQVPPTRFDCSYVQTKPKLDIVPLTSSYLVNSGFYASQTRLRLVTLNQEMTPLSSRSSKMMKFQVNPVDSCNSVSQPKVVDSCQPLIDSYTTGDHLAVYPQNNPELVSFVASRLGVKLEDEFDIQPLNGASNKGAKLPFQGPTTVHHALSHYFDLTGLPAPKYLRSLAEFASDAQEKSTLTQASQKGNYEQFVYKDVRGFVDILKEFPSVRMSFPNFVDLLPPLQPRYYSVAASSKACPNEIHIAYRVLNYTTPRGILRQGVCSNWLARQTTNGHDLVIPSFIRASDFRMPTDSQTPIIMVAGGMGLAPFKAFIEERRFLKQQGRSIGAAMLFYGVREPNEVIMREWLEAAVKDGSLTDLHLVYSDYGTQKEMVSERLLRESKKIYKLLNEGCYMYQCGGASGFARSVTGAYKQILCTEGGLTQQQSEDTFRQLLLGGRYLEDVAD